jgi:hypothetical protein
MAAKSTKKREKERGGGCCDFATERHPFAKKLSGSLRHVPILHYHKGHEEHEEEGLKRAAFLCALRVLAVEIGFSASLRFRGGSGFKTGG